MSRKDKDFKQICNDIGQISMILMRVSLNPTGRQLCLQQFSSAHTNLERLALVKSHFGGEVEKLLQRMLLRNAGVHFKDNGASFVIRAKGNEVYGENNLEWAHKLYTRSVAWAPPDSAELGMALANRSAVLRSQGRMADCLTDITRVLEIPAYPEELRFKLLLRKAQCERDLHGLKLEKTAGYKAAMAHLTDCAALTLGMKGEMMQQLQAEAKVPKIDRTKPEVVLSGPVPSLTHGPGEMSPNISSAVSMQTDPAYGRYLVANRDIEFGSMLIVERPFAITVTMEKIETICGHCFKRCYNLLHCPNCAWALYCSEECRTAAANTYHATECRVLGYLATMEPCHLDSGIHWMFFLVRIVCTAGLQSLEKYINLREEVSDDDPVACLCELQSHEAETPPNLLLQQCLHVLEVSCCFNAAGFPLSDAMEALLLKLISVIQVNSVISEETVSFNTINEDLPTIGSQLLLNFPLLTHACAANCFMYRSGGHKVVCSQQNIKKGEMLTYNYGAFFQSTPRVERQEKLQRNYYFRCHCDACAEDWPTYRHLPSQLDACESETYKRIVRKFMTHMDQHKRNPQKSTLTLKSVAMGLPAPRTKAQAQNVFTILLLKEFVPYLQRRGKRAHQRYLDELDQLRAAFRGLGDVIILNS